MASALVPKTQMLSTTKASLLSLPIPDSRFTLPNYLSVLLKPSQNSYFWELVPFCLFCHTSHYLINKITLWFPKMPKLYHLCVLAHGNSACNVSYQKPIPFTPWPSLDANSSMKASQAHQRRDFLLWAFTVPCMCSVLYANYTSIKLENKIKYGLF